MIKIILLAFKDILRPKILSILILPFVGSFSVWGFITWLSYDWISGLGLELFQTSLIQKLVSFLAPYAAVGSEPFVFITKLMVIMGVIFPLALITALLITSTLLVPVIVNEIRKADFPSIVKKQNSIFQGTGASISLSVKYFCAWVGTLPLWLAIPGGAVIVPYLLLSWFNSRLFVWEVMIELATPDEIKEFIKANSKGIWGVGFVTAILYYIPVLNLIAPVITSAVFSRYCMGKLKT